MSNQKEKDNAFSPLNKKALREMERKELPDEALAAAAGGYDYGPFICSLMCRAIESYFGRFHGCADFKSKNGSDDCCCSNCSHFYSEVHVAWQ